MTEKEVNEKVKLILPILNGLSINAADVVLETTKVFIRDAPISINLS
jgi:hypothetical protein